MLVFEGPDGVGKSTISAAVTTQLQAAGEPAGSARLPGRGPGTLGHLVYEIHHDRARFGMEDITAASLQTLHIAAHFGCNRAGHRPRFARGDMSCLTASGGQPGSTDG
ncbi:MAG: hypothetical protein U0531_09620 [Dehalococcoidia bacterium]